MREILCWFTLFHSIIDKHEGTALTKQFVGDKGMNNPNTIFYMAYNYQSKPQFQRRFRQMLSRIYTTYR